MKRRRRIGNGPRHGGGHAAAAAASAAGPAGLGCEVMTHVMSFLEGREMGRVEGVCKEWRAASMMGNGHVWRERIIPHKQKLYAAR